MKTRMLVVFALGFTLTLTARAQVPGIINYQGRIVDGGTNFNGTGLFKFALVSLPTNTFWSNDGSSFNGGQPTKSVSLTVTKGLYSVLLGDTTISNMTVAVPAAVFANLSVFLRVWFSDGSTNIFQQLSPDQRISVAGYAMQAQNAYTAASATSLSPSSIVFGQSLDIGTNNTLASGVYSSIAGGSNNAVNSAESFVGGGDQNTIQAAAQFSAIGGGLVNTIQASAYASTIGGGQQDTIQTNAYNSTIGGGQQNTIAQADHATIGGGANNTIDAAPGSFIGGGSSNTASDQYDTVSGGQQNSLQLNADSSFIGGGLGNSIHSQAYKSAIGGGQGNTIKSGGWSFIGGGQSNTASAAGSVVGGGGYDGVGLAGNMAGGPASTVGGGIGNTASGTGSFVGGGNGNNIQPNSPYSAISGGLSNTIVNSATCSFIGGGSNNEIAIFAPFSTIGGGRANAAAYSYSTVGGGESNYAGGVWSTVPGGALNYAYGNYSFAAGQQATANYQGDFVWADSSNAPFASTANDQFLIRAQGGVGIGTASPETRFQVTGPSGTGIRVTGQAGGGGSTVSYDLSTYDPAANPPTAQILATDAGNWSSDLDILTKSPGAENNSLVSRLHISSASGYVGINNSNPQAPLDVVGGINCHFITIEGGSDLAEPFPMSVADKQITQGSVVVIDDENPGRLKLSTRPYDTRVAGVVSGANGVHPGIQMEQQALLGGGRNVALSGRVYVQADASYGPIKPGDLLTTSATPGHAMKVTDHARAEGAILGKAMTGLNEGSGFVLVLVTLQ